MPRGVSRYDEAQLQGRLWTPLQISPTVWWDATDLATIQTISSAVSQWSDKISGIPATQGTPANRPTLSLMSSTSKYGVNFNGTNSFLSFGTTGLSTGASALSLMLAASNADSDTNPHYGFGFYGGSGPTRGIGRYQGKAWLTDNGSTNAFGAPWGAGAYSFVEAIIPAGSSVTASVYSDGAVTTTAATLGSTTGSQGAIGALVNGSLYFWNGAIQQILGFNRVINSFERQCMEGWESWYDGKAGSNLPASHPYKNRPPLIGG